MTFSSRTNWKPTDSRYIAAASAAHATGEALIDLTVASPAAVGLGMAAERVLEPLRRVENLSYDPQPFGLLSAREAVAGYYAARGAAIDAGALVLTASTSEAYSYLLRLLCEVDDEILIAAPGYPLLDVLAQVNDVRLRHYPLFYDHGWHIDRAELEAMLTERTRAIIVVHPNNPTGHYTRNAERNWLQDICTKQRIALVVDEVFLNFEIETPVQSFAAGDHPALTFVLSGLSKIAALPQMKAAWLAAVGEGSEEALRRLEIIADSYLSVSTPVQHALPHWLAAAATVQTAIKERVRNNLTRLDSALAAGTMVSRFAVEAGWYAILRLPDVAEDEEAAVRLLQQHRVLVQPGHLFGMSGEGRLVVSLLPEEEVFAEGVKQIVEFAAG